MKKAISLFMLVLLVFTVGCGEGEADLSSEESAYSAEQSEETAVGESTADVFESESTEDGLSDDAPKDWENGVIGEGYSSFRRAELRVFEKETIDKWLDGTSRQKIQVRGREESVYSDSYLEKGRFLINKRGFYTPTVNGVLQKGGDKTINVLCHATFAEVEYPSFKVGEVSVSVRLFYLDESYEGDRSVVKKETLEAINRDMGLLYIQGIDDMASVDFKFAGAERSGLIMSGGNPWVFFYYNGVLAAVNMPSGFYETEDFAALSFRLGGK